MSDDDLVKRLRDVGHCSPEDVAEAADRIEHLEGRCANLLVGNRALNIRSDKLESALIDILKVPRSAADRIDKLEAALRFYACDCKPYDECGIEYYDGGAYCGHAARKALEGKDDVD